MTLDPPLCTFCKTEEETLDHLFIDCPLIRPLWNQLEKNPILHLFQTREDFWLLRSSK